MTHDIAELDLSVRSFNCLKKGGIHTIEQLKEMSDEELLSLRWFGLRCLDEVHERLKKWYGTPTYDDLKAENAKLRELVRDMWEGYNDPRCEECHLKDTPTCADCPICAREASVIDRMRELGVDDG